jgi:excinuclease ABC subunit C
MEKFRFILRKNVNRLPKSSGVYCFKNKKEVLYIGKAADIKERVKNHFQQPSYKDYLFLDKVEKIGYIKTNSEIEALILEKNLIKEIKPKFNVLWRDDKNYFFVGATKEDFPAIFITHQPKKILADFVGPFVDGKALKRTLKILRKIFPFRSCKRIPKRPCLWYHLGRCPAPCTLKSKFFKEIADSSKIKKIAQKSAQRIIKILKEGKKSVLKELKKEMKKVAKEKDFEEAARLRDQILALERIFQHTRIFGERKRKILSEWPKIEKELRKILNTKRKILRIEAFDVSSIRGKLATGSMITFIEGVPDKNFYRRFKIKFGKKPNDISMLKEVLERRLKHKEWGLPDLILIDGGKAQLNCAIKCKLKIENRRLIKVISLAKKEKKLFIEGRKDPLLLKSLPREIFNLILKLDNEAHRFAISYHKKLREKDILKK